jgi:hypothetical protein
MQLWGGLGSTFYGNPDGSLDAYYAAILSPGTYYIFIGYASGNGYSGIPEAGKYTLQVSVENPAVNAVPLPSAAIFLVSGIVGLFSLKRRFKR